MKKAPTAIRLRVSATLVQPRPRNSKCIIPSWPRDAPRRIERIFPRAGHGEQQKASHDGEVLEKILHALDLIRAFHGPEAMLDQRRSQRVERHEHARGTRERANRDRE